MGVKYIENGTFRIDCTGTAGSINLAAAAVPPAGATSALISAEGADLRWRGDGGTPVATSNATARGSILADGDHMIIESAFANFNFIRMGSGLYVDVLYFRN